MGNPVVQTAMCTCSFGVAPATVAVSSQQTVKICKMPAATIMDNKFPTFGMCSSMSNPAVASATSAAAGVLTPQPCSPVIAAPWSPGCATVKVCKQKLLNKDSTLNCSYGGVIQVTMTPAMTVKVP